MPGSIRCDWHKEKCRSIRGVMYKEWGVKINVTKSGIMYICKKRAERCDVVHEVDDEVIPMVLSCK